MRLPDSTIKAAKDADLIAFMLTYHSDRVVDWYGLRDVSHDSLVLYPDSFCRYSTGEVQDNIYYLEHYQNYSWRDAVLKLKEFADSPPETDSVPSRFYGTKSKPHFYKPAPTGRIDLIRDYLCRKRGMSCSTVDALIEKKKIYAASAPGFGSDFVCFANTQGGFYSLRNISNEGMGKLLFTKEPGEFWWFTAESTRQPDDLFERLVCPMPVYSTDIPIYIFESPIDAVSFYELYGEPGIYAAMGGLKDISLANIICSFPYYGENHLLHFDRRTILAVDRDRAGDGFAEKHGNYERIRPNGKDWNEDLCW